jgi:NAD(P)-dependent dehydrogenase (short-subunit alcohol dehydrogenase family)
MIHTSPRRVLVTGAGSGIGLATTVRLATHGYEVVALVPDHWERRGVREAAGAAGVGTSVRPIVCDLADAEARADAVAGLEVYGLVNNAGYMNAGLVSDVSIQEARRQLEVMVLAPLDLAERLKPGMLAAGVGRIVNVVSSGVHTSTPFTGWYQAAKAALRELTDSLREELSSGPIRVVDVEPGGISTNIWPRAREELLTRREVSQWPERYDRPLALLQRVAARAGSAEEVAAAIERALDERRPRRHYRVGPGAQLLRLVSDVVPDVLWDPVVRAATRAGSARA